MTKTDQAKAKAESYVLEEQAGFMLRLAAQRHTGIFQSLAPLNLTPAQFSVLIKVAELGECSQNELGRKTAMDVATTKGVIDRLRARGLVDVKPDLADRRRTLVFPTQETLALLASLQDTGHKITKHTLAPLTTSERKTFLALLGKIC